jgi:sigma-B regulation protein RsbQ
VDVVGRLNVRFSGPEEARPMVFAHGFGCDQTMWRHVAPKFADRFRVITYDLVGAGGSDPAAWDADRYASLEAHAEDLVDLVSELDLHDVVFVGHSVSAMIGALAQVREPGRFARLVMVGPSPRYLDDDGYVGGFTAEAIEELLESLASNYLGWSTAMAPVIVGNPERPQLGQELAEVFCRMDPAVARVFARATFLTDTRDVLPRITAPTLVLQCAEDVIAPRAVGEYVAGRIPRSTLVHLSATGHCPNLSAPEETVDAIRAYLDDAAA